MTISYDSTIKGIYNQLIEGGSKQFEFYKIINKKRMYFIIDEEI